MFCLRILLNKRMFVSLIVLSITLWGRRLTYALPADHYLSTLLAQTSPSEKGFTIDLRELITVVPKDAIPAIIDPQFERETAAEKQMRADEPVIGLSINGESKAYSTYILSAHEIVNDTIGGISIAITW